MSTAMQFLIVAILYNSCLDTSAIAKNYFMKREHYLR